MKKCLQIFSLVIVALCGLFFTACDLSHKHYVDNYGVCKQCGEDTAELLKINNNHEYISKEIYCKENDFAYFKFVASGEDFITINAEEISGTVDYVFLYTKTINNLYLQHTVGESLYYHNSKLTENETYYIKVKVRNAGKIKLTVSPYV